MKLAIDVKSKKVADMLDRVTDGMKREELEGMWKASWYMYGKLQADYLRGGGHGPRDKRLARRSGAGGIAGKVKPRAVREGADILGRIGAPGKAGMILEAHEHGVGPKYGGRGKPIRPKRKKVLRFQMHTATGPVVKTTGLKAKEKGDVVYAMESHLPPRHGFERVQTEQQQRMIDLYGKHMGIFLESAQRPGA